MPHDTWTEGALRSSSIQLDTTRFGRWHGPATHVSLHWLRRRGLGMAPSGGGSRR